MRFLPLALLLALAAPQAQAQIIPSLDLGVAGGVNFASLSDAQTLDLDNSTGYHIGLYADVGVLFASVRTGVYYVRAGDIRADAQTPNDNFDTSFDYVAVPVDFQIKTPTPIFQAYALIGPELRFPVDGLDTFETENVQYAGNVGLGVRGGLPLIGPSGYLELRYGRDLSGLRSDADDDDVKVHLVMIRLGVGI
ncbi:outer membrane beta-barrel protein [Rubrivirga sp.]|uniref:outer membrane beta-barrel protein n=1 Tax=Rubrivirga sp. TaxID=1885344 RepID=UPI003B52E3E9